MLLNFDACSDAVMSYGQSFNRFCFRKFNFVFLCQKPTSISRAFSVPAVTVATVVMELVVPPVGVLGVSGFSVFLANET